jgi:hypothetical protein
MDVFYFSNNNNIVSKLGYSRVRNCQLFSQRVGFESCVDQLLKRGLRLVILGKIESIVQQQMLKKNDNRGVKYKRDS